jgi:hypothetical protein
MNYTLHTDFSEITPQAWNTLLKESISDSPFLRYEYQTAWWKHRGGGEWQNAQLILISASEGGELLGIAPLFLAEYDGQRALLLNGSIEISDYLDLIVYDRRVTRSSLPACWIFSTHSSPTTGTVSIGITSPIHRPPWLSSRKNRQSESGLITKRCTAPHRAFP